MAAVFPLPETHTGSSSCPGDVRSRRPLRRPRQPARSLVLIDGGGAMRVVDPPLRRGLLAVGGVVALVAVVVGLGVLFSFLDSLSQPPAAVPVAASAGVAQTGAAVGEVVVVQHGDTLTSIARALQPEGNIGPLVDRLADLHGPAPLLAGERIDVAPLLSGAGSG